MDGKYDKFFFKDCFFVIFLFKFDLCLSVDLRHKTVDELLSQIEELSPVLNILASKLQLDLDMDPDSRNLPWKKSSSENYWEHEKLKACVDYVSGDGQKKAYETFYLSQWLKHKPSRSIHFDSSYQEFLDDLNLEDIEPLNCSLCNDYERKLSIKYVCLTDLFGRNVALSEKENSIIAIPADSFTHRLSSCGHFFHRNCLEDFFLYCKKPHIKYNGGGLVESILEALNQYVCPVCRMAIPFQETNQKNWKIKFGFNWTDI